MRAAAATASLAAVALFSVLKLTGGDGKRTNRRRISPDELPRLTGARSENGSATSRPGNTPHKASAKPEPAKSNTMPSVRVPATEGSGAAPPAQDPPGQPPAAPAPSDPPSAAELLHSAGEAGPGGTVMAASPAAFSQGAPPRPQAPPAHPLPQIQHVSSPGTPEGAAAGERKGPAPGKRTVSFLATPAAADPAAGPPSGSRATAGEGARDGPGSRPGSRSGSARSGANAAPPSLRLSVTEGPSKGVTAVLEPGEGQDYVLGRHWRSQLTINDGEVSSSHLVVRWDEQLRCWTATDLGSLNGSKLEGELISTKERQRGEAHPLRSNSVIQLATQTVILCEVFRQSSQGSSEEDAAPPPGGGRAKLLRKVNQGSTMISKIPRCMLEDDDETGFRVPWVNFLDSDVERADCRTAEHRDGPSTSFVSCLALGITVACQARVGVQHLRDGLPCEDQAFVRIPSAAAPAPLGGIFAVCDGHYGTKASTLARHNLSKGISEVMRVPPDAGKGYEEGMRRVFGEVDRQLRDACDEGCTATVAVAWRDSVDKYLRIQVANVGDSQCVFVPWGTTEPHVLTQNHRVDMPSEYERISALGVPIVEGQQRLFGLQLGRMLGDKIFKEECHAFISDPHVSEVVKVGDQGGIMVIASDGLWDEVTPEVAAQKMMDALQADAVDGETGMEALCRARDELIETALNGRSKDDITVVVVRFVPEALARRLSFESTHEGIKDLARAGSDAGSIRGSIRNQLAGLQVGSGGGASPGVSSPMTGAPLGSGGRFHKQTSNPATMFQGSAIEEEAESPDARGDGSKDGSDELPGTEQAQSADEGGESRDPNGSAPS